MELGEALAPTGFTSTDQITQAGGVQQTPAFFTDPTAENQNLLAHQANQQQIASYRNQWANDPGKVTAAATFATVYPHMDPKTVIALVNGGYNTDSSVSQYAKDITNGPGQDHINQILAPQKKKQHKSFFSDPWGWTEDEIIKPTTRAVGTALNTPYELGQATFRENVGDVMKHGVGAIPTILGRDVGIVDAEKTYKQSTAGIALSNAAEGKPVDMGTGYFAGGKVAAEQAANARAAAPTIGGHAMTPGRLAASVLMEPGTRPFNLVSGLIDAAAAWEEPGAKALQAIGESARASKTFSSVADLAEGANASRTLAQRTGLIGAVRNAVLPQTAGQFMDSPSLQRTIGRIADTSDAYELRQRLGKNFPADLLPDLAHADNTQDVSNILRHGIENGDLTGPFTLGHTASYQVQTRILDHSRMLNMLGSMMPGRKLPINNPNELLDTFENGMKGAHIDPPVIRSLMNEMIDVAPTRDPSQIKEVAFAGALAVHDRILKQTGNEALAHQLTGLFRKSDDDAWQYGRAFFVDEAGRDAQFPGVRLDGKGNALPSSHLWTEYLNHDIPMWDYQKVRDSTATLARLWDSTPYQVPRSVINHLTSLWGVSRILRPALLPRITGEAQAAMGASGLITPLHPFQYIGILAGDDGRIGRALRSVGVKPTFTGGVDEQLFTHAQNEVTGGMDELDRVLTHGPGNLLSSKAMPVEHWIRPPTDTPEGLHGWAGELHQLYNDPLARGVLKKSDPDAAKAAFWDGDLSDMRGSLIKSGNQDIVDRAGADEYINTIYKRAQIKTSGDERLMGALTDGKIGGETPLTVINNGGKRVVNPDAVSVLRDLRAEGVGPDVVKAPLNYETRKIQGHGATMGELWDKGTDWMFAHLIGMPDNTFTRTVAGKQLYWRHTTDMLPFASPRIQERVLRSAESSRLPDDVMGGVRTAIARGSGKLDDMGDFRMMVKGRAVDESHNMLHDLSSRSQFFEGMRAIFPFGDAWRTMLTRWSKLMVERPNVIHRVDEIIRAGKSHDPFVDLGLTEPHQGGFFHQDRNGNEVFTFPGSQWVTDKLAGIPVGLDAPIKGLNMIAEGLPGFGPGVTFPASALIAATPNNDWVRNKLLPYGAKDITNPSDVASEIVPSFMQKLMAWQGSPVNQRQYNNAVAAAGNYLLSTGEYKINGPNADAEMRRLLSDSTSKAKNLWLLRGLVQATAPAAPTFDWMTRDKSGGLVAQDLMKQRYQEIINQTGDNQTATEAFVHEFGPNAFYTIRPLSRHVTGNLPATNTAADWAAANGDLREKYPLVYGFFAPLSKDSPDNDYSQAEYQRQIDSGERQALTPEQVWRLANRSIAQIRMDFIRKQLPAHPTPVQRAWVDQWRGYLESSYPGYNDDTGLTGTPPAASMIRQLQQITRDPRISGTPTGGALIQYLSARAQALATLAHMGHPSSDGVALPSGNLGNRYRTALEDYAGLLSQQVPEFSQIYDFAFRGDRPPTNAGNQQPQSQLVPVG